MANVLLYGEHRPHPGFLVPGQRAVELVAPALEGPAPFPDRARLRLRDPRDPRRGPAEAAQREIVGVLAADRELDHRRPRLDRRAREREAELARLHGHGRRGGTKASATRPRVSAFT